jgi:outer membrane protein OmpA-like peptidoglycan-associated protein
MPRFLRYRLAPTALARENDPSEREAREFAAGGRSAVTGAAPAANTGVDLARDSVMAASRPLGAGSALDSAPAGRYAAGLGSAVGRARIHADAAAGRVADAIGANAYTLGSDIYFGRGRYQPGTPSGDRLLAHELAHVAQHAGDPRQLHADLAMSLPTGQGVFGIDMADRIAPASPGMEGHITFDPDPAGAYSAEIALIQAIRIESAGATSGVGSPLHFAGPAESERDVLATTGGQGEKAGWHVDTTYADPAKTSGSQTSPSYQESVGFNPTHNEHGYLRSPTDIKQSRMYDYPQSPRPQIRFDFETVAKGMDNQNVYGGLHWGFELRAGRPQSEYAYAMNATSPEFDVSLDRFRAYFTHEPVIIYFDTDVEIPAAGEDFKLDEAMDWLRAYPDAHVEIEGFADERGPAAYNARLSRRRAEAVATELMGRGLDFARIDSISAGGETTTFAPGRQAGQLRANRRARIRFIRNASTPPGP